ncbi:MAG: hypothetical protein WCA78_01745 [Rhizomicrobium sp.]
MRRLFAFALLLAAPAHAETPYQLYAVGKYDEAIKAGVAENDAVGLSVAAGATLAEEASRDQPCLECLERAEDYARRAIAADPKLPEARVYLAFSLGLKAHIEGSLRARLKDYPDQAKSALDAALATDPKNAWALAARGGWNIAIVRGGGATLARLFYGATLKKGLDDFAAAFDAAPDDIVVLYQYALTLSEYDPVHYHDYIAAALTHVASGTPDMAYERLMQKRASDLLEVLKKGDSDAYVARVRKFEGYP